MKIIKHCWKYLTQPHYRMIVDLMMSQEMMNRQINHMKDQIELSNSPPIIAEKLGKYRSMYGISPKEAFQVLKSQGHIS